MILCMQIKEQEEGVRTIGICDTLRRIMGKAILSVIGPEIQAIAGCTQLCARAVKLQYMRWTS